MWCGWPVSNRRPRRWQRRALPAELQPHCLLAWSALRESNSRRRVKSPVHDHYAKSGKVACPGRLELPTCWFEASRSAPTELRAGIWCCGQPPIALFRHANFARLPLTVAEKPGFEPGQDLRPARLANECLRPLGHFSVKWGEPPDSNRHRPGSRPGALPIKLGTPLNGGG